MTAQIYVPQLIQPSLDGLLKRYPEGRRRQRMEPFYRNTAAEIMRFVQPISLYDELFAHDAPHLFAWTAPTTVSFYLAVCTLGAELDTEMQRLVENDMAGAAILSEVALTLITAFTRDLHGAIRQQSAQQNQKAGPAYRPGLGRWPLELQRTIFSLLPTEQIGVQLTEELLMLPAFSTSLIIPVRNL
ncbi:MAG: hypothetical protein H6641_01730 [Caldilineaceae bacterium]|nr:hypothetical protein [Caldilineaceae bacterium]